VDDESDGSSPGSPTKSQVAGGILDGQGEAVNQAGEGMLKMARPGTRFILKRVPGAPALVFDAADFAASPNKTRTAFGIAGGFVGAAAGGALGTAAGGVNAPIGAAAGSTFGQGIGEQIYDEHQAAIDHDVDATKRWMADRWRQLTAPQP
jgi:phage tail tape-measure protein